MITYFLIFVFGAIIGSFINLAAERDVLGLSIIRPSSHCIYCKKNIKKKDLIPILSFLILKGRCRFCGEKIGVQNIIVEILMGFIYLLIFLKFNNFYDILVILFLSTFLIYISIIDFLSYEVADIHLLFLILPLIYLIFTKNILLKNSLVGLLIWTFFALIFKDKMGDGDKILIGILLLYLSPFLQLRFFFITAWSGGIVAIYLLIKGYDKKTALPFIPFITIGFISSLLIYGGF